MPTKVKNTNTDEAVNIKEKSTNTEVDVENTEKVEATTETVQTVEEPVELNMEQKVTIRNIASWEVGFNRIESNGDVTIPPNGTTRLSRSEIIAQVQNGNRLLVGIDSQGSHATIYIEDAPTRVEVDFDVPSEKRTQLVLTAENVKKLFDIKSIKEFEATLQNLVVTRAEKYAILDIIKKEKLNDFEKIRIVENHTGFRI